MGRLHRALASPGDELAVESGLVLLEGRLRDHLHRRDPEPPGSEPLLARRLRELLDEHLPDGLTLTEASALLHAHPAHLVRAYGIAPHRYPTSRRAGRARRRLLDGPAPGEVAVASGFYDQARLTRHFEKSAGVTPGRYRDGA